MNYRMLGRTGLYVSELCFGAMTFGGEGWFKAIGTQGQSEADALVGRCLDTGINFFDTANVYSNGLSEQILGKALGERRKDVVLATKVRGRMGPGANEVGLSRGHIMDSVHASLKRLGTDYIDLYQIHGFDAVTPIDETLRALDDLVRQGKVRYLGASNLAAWQLMKALGISEHRGLARFESLQAYYSIAGRDLERELVPLMKDQQVGLMVWSPLAGGFLSGKYRRGAQGPEGARRLQFDFPPVNQERAYSVIDVMDGIAKAHSSSVARVALAWLLHQPHVTTIVIGAKTAEQLEDNLAAPELKLSPEELAALETVSALPAEYPGWMLDRQGQNRSPAQK
ncbi:oxidoreductase [Cystobacter fuscus]|uniref:Oxidoreductase n=1 Tax=Cystobacter fuscus TaxID=43 RepID=A0A250JFN4_9BACT|nr:aldo/keto reductase [Cystobacter fuscus]ATB42287.1 oxidoreductase [Cystobacter fuscus]